MSKALSWICAGLLTVSSVTVADAAAPKAAKFSAKANVLTMSATSAPRKSVKDSQRAPIMLSQRQVKKNGGFRVMEVKAPMKPHKASLAQSSASVPDIVGNMIYSNLWEEPEFGLYTLPKSADGSFESLGVSLIGNYGGVLVDDIYYQSYIEEFWGFILASEVYGYDVTTGECVYQEEVNISDIPVSQCYDPTSGNIYGIFYNEDVSGYNFATIDYSSTPQLNIIAPVPAGYSIYDISVASDGQLYVAVAEESNTSIMKIDKSTGNLTLVGTNAIYYQYMAGGVIDPKTDIYYITASTDADSYIAAVSLADGSAEKLFDFANGEEMIGLYIATASESKAPAAVSGLEVSFYETSLTGSVNFECPEKYVDGTPASGSVTYHVKVNGTETVSGETTYGAILSVPVTVAESGVYTFSVYLSNENGNGPESKAKMFVGKDIVKAPANVKATYVDNKMTISWDAPQEGVNGGYIDQSAVTYNVNRVLPSAETIVTKTSETSVTIEVPMPETLEAYSFEVSATYEDVTTDAIKSNLVVIGSVIPPYSQDFATDDAMDYMTVIDANNDGKTWTIVDNSARVAYNSSLDMDDWLFTAPLKLEAGKVYRISFKAWAQGTYYTERLEVKIGTQAVPDFMTETLCEPTTIAGAGETKVIDFVPQTSDIYYIGFHGISDADMYYLWLDDISVAAGLSSSAPAQPESISTAGNNDGTTVTTVSIVAPSTTIAGGTLASISKIELFRDNELINEFNSVTPGATVSFVDTPSQGYHTYSAVAYNESGAGMPTSISAYCGVNYPAAVETVNMTETSTPGEVNISWEPVTTDIEGNELASNLVKYNVYDRSTQAVIAEGVSGTSVVKTVVGPGEQDFIQVFVCAETAAGEGTGSVSPMIAVGTPFEGFFESFANATIAYPLAVNTQGGASVALYKDEDLGIHSQDGDNGCVAYYAQYIDYYGDMITPKIQIGDSDQGLSLYMYKLAEADKNILEIYIREAGVEDYTLLTTFSLEPAVANEWNKFNASLADYEGKVVQLKLRGVIKSHSYIIIDNVRVGTQPAYDLSVKSINAPSNVNAGNDYKVSVSVANLGMQSASDYTVTLFADGKAVDKVTASEELVSGAATVFEFNRSFSPLAEEAVTYKAEITWAPDLNTDDNVSEEITVAPIVSTLPAVNDLSAEVDGTNVTLTWSEPNIEGGISASQTEDFEDGESFAQEFKDWKFIDNDKSEVGGFQNIDIPGISIAESKVAFFVFDASGDQFNQSFAGHSGDKYLAALFRADDGQTDDWAISPVLSGNAQTISFFARSYSSSYPEKIEMYYSTGSLNTDDFILVKTIEVVPDEWTLVDFDVPAGATYFAIRSCATGSFMLLIDDVTFESASASSIEVSILGYNVFCDGVQINETPVEECEYVTTIPDDNNDHVFRVTTVYDLGQSAGSNEVSVKRTGINAAAANAIAVKAVAGKITITGAEGLNVAVYNTAGKVIYSSVAAATTTVDVTSGVYVVTVGKETYKVLAR